MCAMPKANNSIIIITLSLLFFTSCKEKSIKTKQLQNTTPKDMVWISGGTYYRGAALEDSMARSDEKPVHKITVNGFWMDEHEVTNAQFKEFIDDTGYITTAERQVNWEDIKKQLPIGTPKPHDSILQPGSLSFQCKLHEVVNFDDYSQWWQWKNGASWKHPQGKNSTIKGKENHPVVHVSYEDAMAYCKWSGKRLPTEAEWEYAARGGLENNMYTWGNDAQFLSTYANTWEGIFPTFNTKKDGFERSAPVKSYPPNGYGLYEMAGNVWEWTQDWYDFLYYKSLSQNENSINPTGPKQSRNPSNPYSKEKVIRGGSFLCHDSYCASYRVTARMSTSEDTALEHLGFRTVLDKKNN